MISDAHTTGSSSSLDFSADFSSIVSNGSGQDEDERSIHSFDRFSELDLSIDPLSSESDNGYLKSDSMFGQDAGTKWPALSPSHTAASLSSTDTYVPMTRSESQWWCCQVDSEAHSSRLAVPDNRDAFWEPRLARLRLGSVTIPLSADATLQRWRSQPHRESSILRRFDPQHHR
jgi:hypothetical protein